VRGFKQLDKPEFEQLGALSIVNYPFSIEKERTADAIRSFFVYD